MAHPFVYVPDGFDGLELAMNGSASRGRSEDPKKAFSCYANPPLSLASTIASSSPAHPRQRAASRAQKSAVYAEPERRKNKTQSYCMRARLWKSEV